MPTYQYACTDCEHGFEAVQAFTDDSLTECPECQGRLRKVFGAVGIVFKGSGFYRTDSREGAKAAPAAASETSSTDKGADTKKVAASGTGGTDKGGASTGTTPSNGTTPKSKPASAPAAGTRSSSSSTGKGSAA